MTSHNDPLHLGTPGHIPGDGAHEPCESCGIGVGDTRISGRFTLPGESWQLHCELAFWPGSDPLDTDEQIEVRAITDATGERVELSRSLWLSPSDLTREQVQIVYDACAQAELEAGSAA